MTGNKVLEDDYDEIIPFTDKLFITNKFGLYGLRNVNGETVLEEKYSFIGTPNEDYAKIGFKGKWGFINTEGKIVIETRYENVGKFNLGIGSVKENGLWFLIGKEGEKVYEKGFYKIGDYFTSKFIPVELQRRYAWDFYNDETKIVLKISSPLYRPYEKLEWVVIGDHKKRILINTDGKAVLPYYFSDISVVDSNRFIVKTGNKEGIVDLKMRKISDFIYDRIYKISEYSKDTPFFNVKINENEGVLDYNGNIIIEPGMGYVVQLSSAVFMRSFYNKQHNKETVIFNTGSKEPFFKADYFERLSNNLFSFEIENKWGVIDSNGKIVIKAKYNSVKLGAENQFIVKDDDEYGVLDLEGKPVIDISYKSITFKNNRYIMNRNSSSYIYENSAKEFKNIGILEICDDKLICTGKNEKSWGFGVMDLNGNVIVPFQYHRINFDRKLNHFIVRKY